MTKKKLLALDKLLVELQRQMDRQSPLHPHFHIIVNARMAVEEQIQRIERKRSAPPEAQK